MQLRRRVTPLLRAVRDSTVKVAQLLIESGACVNTPDDLGHTPLFLTVACRRQNIVAMVAIGSLCSSPLMIYTARCSPNEPLCGTSLVVFILLYPSLPGWVEGSSGYL